jgi:glycosyltransferase involved in cell wall biosynthesis
MNRPSDSPPLVTVVIPAFNSAAFIRRATDSALAQDYPNKEIVVVDDGSTDDTATIVESYGPPVRLIRQANAGPDAARNNAIRASHAEFIAFLDSDDEYLPGRLTASIQPMLDDPGVGLTFCHALMRYPDGSEINVGADAEGHRIFPRVFWRPATQCTPATTCRRSLLLETGGFDRPLIAFADVDLWIRITERSRAVEIDRPLVLCHARPESRSRNKDEEAVRECYFRIIRDGLARRPDLYEPHRATIEAEAWHFWGLRYYARGLHRRARECFVESYRRAPTRRAVAFMLKTFAPPGLMRRLRAWKRGRASA